MELRTTIPNLAQAGAASQPIMSVSWYSGFAETCVCVNSKTKDKAMAVTAPTMGRCPRLRMLWVTPLMKGPARNVESSRCVDCTSVILLGGDASMHDSPLDQICPSRKTAP